MIGDILHDVEAGNRAGCRTILIDNGHETLWARTPATRMLRTAHIVVPDLDVASRAISRAGQSGFRSAHPALGASEMTALSAERAAGEWRRWRAA